MEISPPDSWQSLFETPSFVLIIRDVKITHDTIYNIYLKSKSFTNSLKNFVISENQFDINFEEEQGETVRIMLNQESIFFLALDNILKKPFEVIFEDINEVENKKLMIFRKEAYRKILFYLSRTLDKYYFIENKKAQILTIMRKKLTIPDEIFIEAKKNDFKSISNLIVKNVSINPIRLSSNFYYIFNDVKKGEDFNLIINQERINFYKKLIDFIDSEKTYYYIIGSDGIGKSISLLYFSLLTKYRFIYFNLKLYWPNNTEQKFNELFINDLHKFFSISI
jgi:hypothetical protein